MHTLEICGVSASATFLAAKLEARSARKLLDILRALPESAEVTLQQQDKRLVVKAGKSRFALQTLPAEDFPRLAKPAGDTARFTPFSSAKRVRPATGSSPVSKITANTRSALWFNLLHLHGALLGKNAG